MMHHALHIEEILLNIFNHCYTLVYRRRRGAIGRQCYYANVHLATLARICKAFKEPALDMIWADLDDLTPLVQCLPQESWGVHTAIHSFEKHLEQADWDIILGYARRVRALRLRHYSGLAADCIKTLSNPPAPTESIFPNLRMVELYKPSAKIVPLLRHLVNPRVTDISFHHTEIVGPTIETFGVGCPFVTDVHVCQTHTDTISGLIYHWKNLRSVYFGKVDLHVDVLSHLSRLRNLLYVSLRVHNGVADQIHASSMFIFSALHNLHFRSPSLTPVGRLLRHFRVPVVHDLSVRLHIRPTARDLLSFFAALQEACTHCSLNNFSLHVCDRDDTIISSPRSSPPYYINFERLHPLTIFANIKSITLDIPCGVDLNERELLALASSWPHLEKFQVGEDYDWATSSGITPEGFLQLLEMCRSLRVFYFIFDTRAYTEIPQGHPWRGLTMPSHAKIHLLNSPIEEASIEALGVFFHVAPFPDFDMATHWNDGFFGGGAHPGELHDLYYGRWQKVCELARDLWEARRDLRRSLETCQSPRLAGY